MQIKNIEMEINNNINMKTNQMNMMTMQMNMMSMIMNPMNNPLLFGNNNIPKLKILFISNIGEKEGLPFYYGTTVGEMLRKFCQGKNLEERKYHFIYNAERLNFDDDTKIETKFISYGGPIKIIFQNIDNLIGG